MKSECFECGSTGNLENHHVVPKSKGGTKTVSLCPKCHGLVHSMNRTDIRKLTKDALQKKKKKGYRVGNIAYGYKLAEDAKKLVPDETEQYIFNTIKNLRKNGATLKAIAEHLNQSNQKTRTGNQFKIPHIQKLLKIAQEGERLVLDQTEQDVLNIIKKLRKSGVSLQKIADHLNNKGYKTRRGNNYQKSTVKNLVKIAEKGERGCKNGSNK